MKKYIYRHLLIGISGVAICTSTTAIAGFEFTAPIAPTQAPVQDTRLLPVPQDDEPTPVIFMDPSLEPTPTAQTQPEVKWSTPVEAKPAPQQAQVQQTAPVTGIMSIAPQPVTPKSVEATSEPKPIMTKEETKTSEGEGQKYALAVGFGNSLPLVSALRQVVPADYTYVLTTQTDAGSRVSWNGGQEWPTVLNEMLAPIGLTSSISGKIVKIHQTVSTIETAEAMESPAPQTSETQPDMASEGEENEVTLDDKPNKPTNMFTVDYTRREGTNQPESESVTPAQATNDAPEERQAPMLTAPDMVAPVSLNPKGYNNAPYMNRTTVEQEGNKEAEDKTAVALTGEWTAQKGTSLKDALQSWADKADVDLFWSSDYDYYLTSDVSLDGSFENAVQTILKDFSEAQPKPIARLHNTQPGAPTVLVVETRKVVG